MADTLQTPDEAETRVRPCRHAGLVSASTVLRDRRSQIGSDVLARRWTLNQVQGDAGRGHLLAGTTAVFGAMDIVFGECDR